MEKAVIPEILKLLSTFHLLRPATPPSFTFTFTFTTNPYFFSSSTSNSARTVRPK